MPKRRKATNNALRGAVLDGQRDMLIETARTRRSTTIRELVDLADELDVGDITVAELLDGPGARPRPAPRKARKKKPQRRKARAERKAKRATRKAKRAERKAKRAKKRPAKATKPTKDLRSKGARAKYDANVLRALVTSSEPFSGPELLAEVGGTAIALRASIARLETADKAKSWGERRAKLYASKRVAAKAKRKVKKAAT